MDTLLELLPVIQELGDREAVRYHNGYRTWTLSYGRLYDQSAACSDYLHEKGFQKGERIILWGENRPEWVGFFWACVAAGLQIVPLDFHTSAGLVGRIAEETGARLLVCGDSVDPSSLPLDCLYLDDVARWPPGRLIRTRSLGSDDVVEIIYTSGTTGEPKGVVHRHRNICANLHPFEHEIARYRPWARPFQPLRILQMLPLSHLFGQSLGLFLPPLLHGSVVFTAEFSSASILETLKRERISVMVCVPRLLRSLQQAVRARFDLKGFPPDLSGPLGIPRRLWRHRRIHRATGWKFWAFVVGGARLSPELEEFWARLGYLVVQGYGLTETSPVISVNHPLRARRGSIGQVLPGQEVRIAPDGEILVKGPNVVTEYLRAGPEAVSQEEEGWLHTGDLGEVDAQGNLFYKGRKKDLIVTSDGLNVYPEDVEAALNRRPEIRESAVVGLPVRGEEQVHAALILSHPQTDPAAIVRAVNGELESHQLIRSWSVWPQPDFPRTPSTHKIRRIEVLRLIQETLTPRGRDPALAHPRGTDPLREALAELTGKSPASIQDKSTLAQELGLSSLDRVDLLGRMEDRLGVRLDESLFSKLQTVGELRSVESGALPGSSAESAGPATAHPPRWNRSWAVRLMRLSFQSLLLRPLFRRFVHLTVKGVEQLDRLEPPVLFAANHQSHLDTPAILAALPAAWRRRLAPAMSQEFFRAYFEPFEGGRFYWCGLQYLLAAGLFNAYPLPSRMSGVRAALRYTGELADGGYCPLVFPEGERTRDGLIHSFRPGIGLMAAHLRIPIVPVRLDGLYHIYSVHDRRPRTGPACVSFGPPLDLESRKADYAKLTAQVESALRALPGLT